jgi:salicylate hydroxylase
MDISKLRIAVVGGGYAGASTAKALLAAGARHVTVFEQAPASGEVGAGIGLRPSSLDAFREWGSLDAILKVSSPSEGLSIFTPTGELVHRESWPEVEEFGITTRFVHRRDFIDALLSVLPDGVVRFGHRLTSIVDNGAAATLEFESGARDTFDLVVGADGISSLVRRTFFSDKPPVFAHEHAYRSVFDIDLVPGVFDDDADFHMYFDGPTNRHLYLLPLKHRGQVSFDITVPSDDASWAPTITREQIVAALKGFDPRFERITETIDLATVNARSAHDIDPVALWHTDSVVILGDAAHAMLHHQGQGANSAILDAKGLADALTDAESVPAGLTLFQARRKPITDEFQRISRGGWEEDGLEDAFPGQHGAAVGS